MISKKEVQHMAELARLGLSESEIRKFQKELSEILDYFNLLKKVDVSGVEPTFLPAERFFDKKPEIMREDKEKPQLVEAVNKLIAPAPDKKERYLKVKAVF